MTLYIKVSKLTDDAIVPTKAYESDAGWDLYSSEDTVVVAGKRNTIKTGISFEIPEGWCGLIWPRSGLSVKNGIDVLAGVIDSSYRGEIMVCLHNTSDSNFQIIKNKDIQSLMYDSQVETNPENKDLIIKKGDRIAQILFHKVPEVKMVEDKILSKTKRNEGGFGSSGR